MQSPIQVFKRKLTNLSSANPLLWMGRLKGGVQLDLAWLEQNEVKPTGYFLDQILEGKKQIPICQGHNPRFGDENQSSRKLRQLIRNQETLLQERGVDDMFLAWPFAAGRWPDGNYFRTPFLFTPVRLSLEGNQWILRPELERAMVNPAYLLAYAHHFKLPPDPDLYEKELDLEAGSRTEFLHLLYQRVKESSLELNFNSGLFSEPVHPFQNWKKSEPPPGFEPGTIRLRQEAVLGLFSFSDSLLLPDFEYLEEKGVELESIFLKPPNPGPGSDLAAIQPLEADGSQEECLQFIHEGNSLVVQGPPGTGKSQLIANVMARMASMGRSVLLVCQKRVALEVVRKRLADLGLSDHLAMWADFKNDLGPLYQQIGYQIERLDLIEEKNKDLSTVVKERSFRRNAQEMQTILQTWEKWREDLFDESLAGINWLDIGHALSADLVSEFAELDFSAFRRPEWLDFLRKIRQDWTRIYQSREPETWLCLRSDWIGNGFHLDRLRELKEEAQNLMLGLTERNLNPDWDHWLSTTAFGSFPEMPDFELLPKEAESGFFRLSTQELINQIQAHRLRWDKFQSEGFTQFLRHSESQSFLQSWNESQQGSSFWFRIQSWWSPEKRRFLNFLNDCQKSGIPKSSIQSFLEVSLQLTEPAGFLGQSKSDWYSIPSGLTIRDWIAWTQKSEDQIRRWEKILDWHKSIPDFAKPLFSEPKAFSDSFSFLQKGRERLLQLKAGFEQGFDSQQAWAGFLQSSEKWWGFFQSQQARIQAGEACLARYDSEEKALVYSLLKHAVCKDSSIENWLNRLEQAWLLFWQAKLWNSLSGLHYPEDQLEKDRRVMQDLLVEKRALSRDLLKLRVEENSYKNLERNRLQNRVTYRGLYQQVSRKRKRQPLRSLWEPFGEEILRLVPCWLATPESVSATFPMTARFDLVIFDEASQCFAENGIPAAYRGKQILVLGDDKQLPPNQLFSTRWEEEGDLEEYFTGQDSLLDLARQFLPQKMLKGHYRSVFPELIQFSNAHFYRGLLEVIPAPETLEIRPARIEFQRIEGVWENQENEQEARRLVRDLLAEIQRNPSAQIGIITFNQKQQTRIEEELEYQSTQEGILLPSDLFVKNIENVQGDERDQIWFSIGYGPNSRGKWTQQFGSLSQEGGENRLNVAISRARQRIRIYTSVWPTEFHAQEEGPKGPWLLKKYLEMAAEISSQNQLNLGAEKVSGSLTRQFKLTKEKGLWTLDMQEPSILFGQSSVKDLLAIKPAYLERLGYRVRLSLKWDFFNRRVD